VITEKLVDADDLWTNVINDGFPLTLSRDANCRYYLAIFSISYATIGCLPELSSFECRLVVAISKISLGLRVWKPTAGVERKRDIDTKSVANENFNDNVP
jgi:hypothetical protein